MSVAQPQLVYTMFNFFIISQTIEQREQDEQRYTKPIVYSFQQCRKCFFSDYLHEGGGPPSGLNFLFPFIPYKNKF